MKTTVTINPRRRVSVEPTHCGGVRLQLLERSSITGAWLEMDWQDLTQDQAGALIFGLERAAEAARIAQDRFTEQEAQKLIFG